MNTFAHHHLDQQDVVLLIAAGADGPFRLDPIRVMKGCFLVSQRGAPEWQTLFNFSPYDYGPFDSTVYRARDALLAHGLLVDDGSTRYGAYALTRDGHAAAQRLRDLIGPANADWFAQIGRYVTSKSFTDLLDEVYAAYPTFATNSLYRQP